MALFDAQKQVLEPISLADKFIVPPFSILDTRQGYWQTRKHEWTKLGIQSELGRDGNAMTWAKGGGVMNPTTSEKYGRKNVQQASIFDPVICELTYRWFSRVGDKVLDPFAGGSVRGIVAGCLDRNYVGVDIRQEQVDANIEQLDNILVGRIPHWVCGDSRILTDNSIYTIDDKFDLIFTCPPYWNMEVYSNLEGDISNCATYGSFLSRYMCILRNCCELLKDDSFMVLVVSNFRDKNGGYIDLVGDTINIVKSEPSMMLYNDCIIINTAGSLPIRTPIQFGEHRKMGRQHQNYLVFYKGNPKNIKDKFGSNVIDWRLEN